MKQLVAFPQLGNYFNPLRKLITNTTHLKVIEMPKITKETISLGSKNSPDTVCVPFKYNLGNFIEALDKGATVLFQAGGGCRYRYYAEVQEAILKDLGYNFTMYQIKEKDQLRFSELYNTMLKLNPYLSRKKLIKEITGRDAKLVLDPTMLLKSIDKYAIIPDEKDYILIYDYNVSNERKKKIKKLAKEMNLPVYSIGFYCKWADKNIDANIFEFIGYMKNATYVVTATFHGTIFSILTKKQFVSYACLGYKIEDLLKRLELTDRDATGIENLSDIIDKPINYDRVFNILEDERKISIEYLKNALENEV